MNGNSKKTILFRMNGVAPGFLREYGCRTCPQCSSAKPQAHISASLIVKGSWEEHRGRNHHILFDCGLGAIDSLIDFGAPPVDQVFLSHGHPYHSLGFDRLVWGQFRHGGPIPIPVFCTKETYDVGPWRIYPWFFEQQMLVHKSVDPLQPVMLDPNLGVGLRITPVSVYQGSSAPGAVIWLVEFGRGENYRKLVLAWELIHFLPPLHGEDIDPDYKGTAALSKHFTGPCHDLLFKPDELFFDGNTRTGRSDTHHMSIEAGFRFMIPELQPKRTWVVHYSGHEDPGGPLSDQDLQHWIDKEKSCYGLSSADIRLGQHGMLLAYEV